MAQIAGRLSVFNEGSQDLLPVAPCDSRHVLEKEKAWIKRLDELEELKRQAVSRVFSSLASLNRKSLARRAAGDKVEPADMRLARCFQLLRRHIEHVRDEPVSAQISSVGAYSRLI